MKKSYCFTTEERDALKKNGFIKRIFKNNNTYTVNIIFSDGTESTEIFDTIDNFKYDSVWIDKEGNKKSIKYNRDKNSHTIFSKEYTFKNGRHEFYVFYHNGNILSKRIKNSSGRETFSEYDTERELVFQNDNGKFFLEKLISLSLSISKR